jgi:hypothetical protein
LRNRGIFDELVIDEWLHVEQMDTRHWWMRVGGTHINIWIARDGVPVVRIHPLAAIVEGKDGERLHGLDAAPVAIDARRAERAAGEMIRAAWRRDAEAGEMSHARFAASGVAPVLDAADRPRTSPRRSWPRWRRRRSPRITTGKASASRIRRRAATSSAAT